jgi:CheY-like chemotaxis protein/GAF domain-containing protein
MLQGQKDLLTVGKLILSELAPVVTAHQGVFYMMDAGATTTKPEDAQLKLLASYAYRERKSVATSFRMGEGLVGQCALEKERILLTNVPENYIQITSGLGEAKPNNIIVLPIVFEGQVKAVMELASFERFNTTHLTFLDQLTESIGIVLNTLEANMRTEDLLKQSQSLARELQAQQDELQQTNAELEEKAKLLVLQNEEVARKNREVEQARQALEEKASQLALTSKYKSEFLANMSHELRTPLNSLLILANQLAENSEGNLTPKQVEFAKTIHGSGIDLLTLINDILDLSKIESGTVSVDISELPISHLHDYIDRTFRHVAENKKLTFDIKLDSDLPKSLHTDTKRLQQVLKNLLSNAFKFTEHGEVSLRIFSATEGWSPENVELQSAKNVVAFSVTDTGIGIAPEKQQIIFEAFQQADGSTNRRFGGTGLGLAISREIARLLGGEIRLSSKVGEGSNFTLYLPQNQSGIKAPRRSGPVEWTQTPRRETRLTLAQPNGDDIGNGSEVASDTEVMDDRENIVPGDRVVMIVEDDLKFATYLLDMARDHGFKGIVTSRGAAALSMAREHKPDAITLDLGLPDIEGWKVLDRLKDDPNTRHIPVQIITAEEEKERGLKQGALSFLTKPVQKETLDEAFNDITSYLNRQVKTLLIVEDDETQRRAMAELVGSNDVLITGAATAGEALKLLRENRFDCMVLDLGLPDMSGFELMEEIKKETSLRTLPVIVYTGRELSRKEEAQLKRMAKTIIVKDVRSPERLLDETALFLHRVQANLPERQRKMLEQLHKTDEMLAGKKVLVVDDDIRNIFAMTSLLERHQMQVVSAENGRDAIKVLEGSDDIDVVLMDIMMPEMDGYDTIHEIRKLQRFKALPILALTAKAMKGDREKCIEAGASDYISKPVDTEQLLSLLRVWLHR